MNPAVLNTIMKRVLVKISENNCIILSTKEIYGYDANEGSSLHLSIADNSVESTIPQNIAPRVKSNLGTSKNHLKISK